MDLAAPSVLSSWTKTIVDALVAEGVDADAVLKTRESIPRRCEIRMLALR